MKVLIAAEIFKLLRQSKTYFALAALFFVELIILFAAYFQGSNIIEILLDNLRQSFYFEGELLNGNLLIYLILNTLWFHLPLILMIVISGMLTSEYKDKTLQTVMLQPVSKWKFMMSKYIVAVLFTLLVVFFLALTSIALSYSVFGTGDLVVNLGTLNFFSSTDALYRLCLAFASGALSMVFFSVVSLTLAVIFKEATKTWIIAAFFLILSNLLLKVDFGYKWINKLFFVKLNDTWQYFFYNKIDWEIVAWNNVLLIVYSGIVMAFGIFLFHKNDIG